jgi:hypothetical protein
LKELLTLKFLKGDLLMKKLFGILSILFIMLFVSCGSGGFEYNDPSPPSPIFTGDPYPTIQVEPDSLNCYTTGLNRRSYVVLTITNNGKPDLKFTGMPIIDNPVFVFDADESDLLLPLGFDESMKMYFYFAPTEWDTEYNGTITIGSNDPYKSEVHIPITGRSQDITPSAEISIDGMFPDLNDNIDIEFQCVSPKPKVLKVTGIGDGFFFRIDEPSNSEYSVSFNGNEITDSWYIASPLHDGDTVTVDLLFHPTEKLNYKWTWDVYTNDPSRPKLYINVIADCK